MDLCGQSGAALEAHVDGSGLLSGPLAEVLGSSRGRCGRSGPLSVPLWAVLARYRGLRGRSGTAFGCFSKKCVFLEEEHEK